MNVPAIAPGVTFDAAAGYWRDPARSVVSYPETGHAFCAAVEDQSFWFAHRNRVIAACILRFPPAAGPLLDVGAGNGYVASALERLGIATVAIEPSDRGAANAAKRGLANVVCGALPSEAFRTKTAGGIGLFDVIEHVQHDSDWLAALRAYVAPGGRVYMTVPAYSWLWSDIDEYSGHYRRYTTSQLCQLLESAGFIVEFSSYFFWCLPLPMYLLRTLRRSPSAGGGQEHTAGGTFVRGVMSACLALEAKLIARGRSVPFGASCIVVGRAAEDQL